jgi:hypothetical protein
MDTLALSAYVWIMPDEKVQICWICRRPVPPEKGVRDEFGFLAHEECVAKQKAKAGRA